MVGPLAARILTDNLNEWPAVWCLLSIALFLIAIKSPLRQLLYVKSWWLWNEEEIAPSIDLKPLNESPKVINSVSSLETKS